MKADGKKKIFFIEKGKKIISTTYTKESLTNIILMASKFELFESSAVINELLFDHKMIVDGLVNRIFTEKWTIEFAGNAGIFGNKYVISINIPSKYRMAYNNSINIIFSRVDFDHLFSVK